MRIAISTGGGDAPGLNAVIRAAVLSAHNLGWEVFGIRRGYRGLLTGEGVIPLGPNEVRGITHTGGTILGTTNRGNPFRWVEKDDSGSEIEVDRSDELIAKFKERGFDALVAIGGDGSLQIAYRLYQKGLPVVGVPKTIDNDVAGTLRTFGFDTALTTATEAIDKLHPTAEAHDRVMVVELMGRDTGWIALYAGVAATADVILIPELPFDINKVCDKICDREREGLRYSIVVVAEGARPVEGTAVLVEGDRVGAADPPGPPLRHRCRQSRGRWRPRHDGVLRPAPYWTGVFGGSRRQGQAGPSRLRHGSNAFTGSASTSRSGHRNLWSR